MGFLYPINKIGETMKNCIGCSNLLVPCHHGGIEEPTAGKTRLQFQLVEHETQAAGRIYDILQLHTN